MNYDQLHKELLADAEAVLANSPDEGFMSTLVSLVFEEPDQIRKRSDTDLILICQFAALGVTHLAKRRQELKELEA